MTSVSDELAGLQEDEIKEMKKQVQSCARRTKLVSWRTGRLNSRPKRSLRRTEPVVENGSLQQQNKSLTSENGACQAGERGSPSSGPKRSLRRTGPVR